MDLQTQSRHGILVTLLTLVPDDWPDQYVSLLLNHLVGLGVRHWSQMLVQGKGQCRAHIYMWVPRQSLFRVTPDVVFECSPRGARVDSAHPPDLWHHPHLHSLPRFSSWGSGSHDEHEVTTVHIFKSLWRPNWQRKKSHEDDNSLSKGLKSKEIQLSCETTSGRNPVLMKSHFYFIKNTRISNAAFFTL